MKALMPWFCLVATAGVQAAFANDGLDAYREGKYIKAAQDLAVSTAKKDAVVDYYIARMRLYGYGQLKNNIIAMRYFQSAAEKGYLPAQRIMGSYALLEEKNPEQALVWFKKAANENDIQAQMYCAAAYLFGVGTKKNSDLARRYFIAAAKSGDSIAQYAVADSFLTSRQSSNKTLGLLWLNKSVAQNNPAAQLKLGEMYAKGDGVSRDLNKAKELIGLSLAQGYVPAMFGMGELMKSQNDLKLTEDWYQKAANAGFMPAETALAELYLQPNSPLFDAHKGFLLMLKAAQNGSSEAQLALSVIYKNGQGVPADVNLAAEWKKRASESVKDSPQSAQMKAAKWLTLGKKLTLADSGYRLRGIFSDWHNRDALKQNNYNAAPRMEAVSRKALYQPKFVLMSPNEIPLSDFYNALAAVLDNKQHSEWSFPRYPLDKQGGHPSTQMPTSVSNLPKVPANGNAPAEAASSSEKFKVSRLEERAVLGDPFAQFVLGQMYQDGIGVNKDMQNAIKYYTLATAQQELRAEYTLALIYLEGRGVNPDYQQGISLLRDAAFKGNDYAQYSLALIYEKGLRNAAGELVIKPDESQALDMYDLAAANDYGLAQYRLAEILVRQKNPDMVLEDKQKQNQLIKKLYQSAFAAGVEQAALPLAYFNAMDNDKAKQAMAFEVAKKETRAGNTRAALLLGLLFDRGIATPASHKEAMYWYQQAPSNPISSFILGTYISLGDGISQDLPKGKSMLQEAADAGFSYANLNLAVLQQQAHEAFLPALNKSLELGNGTAGLLLADYYLSLANNDEQMKQARDIYQRLAEKGNRDGQLKLGFMFDKGLGGTIDAESAAKWYTASAEQGQAVAQYLLGELYQLGKLGTEPNYQAAKKWYSSAQSTYEPAAVALGFIYDTVDDDYQRALTAYQLAADRHDPTAAFNLGLIYEKGKGCPVDFAKAKIRYEQAAEKGQSQAMVQLAGLYFNGSLGSRDGAQALEWYKKAAALGSRDALYQLGLLSETGVGLKLDFQDAVRYYQESANKGNAKAKLALARMYQYGLGVEKNNHQAEKLYEELAQMGNDFAQYQLATFYYDGIDGLKMPDKGRQLLKQAQENGNQQARRILQRLDAEAAERSSFIEPAILDNAPILAEQPADLMYLDALNEWNRGDEQRSRKILDRIVVQFPHYVPAKRAYEQLNHPIDPAFNG